MPSHRHVEGCARLNIMRLNAARLNYFERQTAAIIGGIDRSRFVRIEGAGVVHVLNDAPDTLSVRVHGFVPTAGQQFDLYDGGSQIADDQLFGGKILETTVLYESRAANVAYDVRAIDPTWLLSRRRVLNRYANVSATAIIRSIIETFTRGITTTHVAANLPIIDLITFTNETVASCLTAICERLGAYWYLDYAGDLHVYYSESPDADAITDSSPRGSSEHTLTEDLSQVVTRVIARGGGGQTAADVVVGATELPVTDHGWYSDAGGVVEIAAMRLTYSGVRGRSGTGGLIGVGITPTSAPTVHVTSGQAGTGLASGTYQYALTFANATGETVPGPTAAATVGGTAPTLVKTSVRPGYYADYQGKTTGGRYAWRIALGYAWGGWALGPPVDYVVCTDRRYEIFVGIPQRDPVSGYFYYPGLMSGTVAEIQVTNVYRTVDGGSTWYRENFWSGVVSTASGWLDTANQMTDADLLADDAATNGLFRYPTGPIATFNATQIAGMQPLPAGFTIRKLYRTTVDGAQLKLLATDPADPVNDTTADAALGPNAPTVDTSGVVVAGTQTVPAGATTIPVTDPTAFGQDGGASGGWATVGNLAIRYGGISGATLTGIPATGPGALTAAVRHGAVVLVQPRLIGLTIARAIPAGEAVTLRVELDDPDAQLALAARFGSSDPVDGVVEETYSDSRMTRAELEAYARALLLERKDPRLTLRFVTRDTTVAVGRLITVQITSPPIQGTFRVQRITFDEIAITGGLGRTAARRHVEASNKLYTFADLLRRLRGREGGAQ